MFNDRMNVNDFMIGVEFQGDTNRQNLTDAQIESLVEYLKPLIIKYRIPLSQITTHEQIRNNYNDYVRKNGGEQAPEKHDINLYNYNRIINRLLETIYYKKSGGKMTKLEKLKTYVPKHQNGAKLKKIELSEEANVIPEGNYHKNKHHLDLDNVTEKGIPVVTVNDDSVDTFVEIKQQEDSIQQHAEIEVNELTMNLELTKVIEEARKQWHESKEKDDNICIEIGKRLTKEILYNTDDNTNLIQKIEEHE